jgi:hypothetical protein
MSAIAAIGAGIAKGIGGIARGVRNRKIRKAGGVASAAGKVKTGFFSPERKAARQEKRAAKRASGGGFLKKAVARRREKKAAGGLKRQIRRARKEEQRKGLKSAVDETLDVGTGLPEFAGDFGGMAQETGGEDQAQTQQGGNAVTSWIANNWVILLIGAALILLGKTLFSRKKK